MGRAGSRNCSRAWTRNRGRLIGRRMTGAGRRGTMPERERWHAGLTRARLRDSRNARPRRRRPGARTQSWPMIARLVEGMEDRAPVEVECLQVRVSAIRMLPVGIVVAQRRSRQKCRNAARVEQPGNGDGVPDHPRPGLGADDRERLVQGVVGVELVKAVADAPPPLRRRPISGSEILSFAAT